MSCNQYNKKRKDNVNEEQNALEAASKTRWSECPISALKG